MGNKGKIIEISSVDSTNNYASGLLKTQNLADGTIIWAKSQLKGRGQKGNSWYSEDFKNITCSIVISPQFLSIEKQFFLSILISNSIIEFLQSKVDNLFIKWPNDIYYNDFKLSGILVENTISGSVLKNTIIGIGININQKEFPKELPNAVSLSNISGKEYNLKELIKELSNCFSKKYDDLKNGRFQQLKRDYIDNLYMFGKSGKFRDGNGVFVGEITDVLDSGELIITDESGNKRYYLFKEVEFIGKG